MGMMQDFQRLGAERGREVANIKSDVKAMLKGFDEAHATMSRGLKAELAKAVPALREAEAERKRKGAQEIVQRRSDVKAMKGDVATMIKEFARLDAERRAEVWGVVAPQKVEVPLPKVEVAPPVEIPEEEAIAQAVPIEVTPETVALRDQVFEYLASHPDGTRLVELEREFWLPRLQMARVIKSLIEENKAEKRGPLYFAI